MHCHEVDYRIIGSEIQLVEIELDPGGFCRAIPGKCHSG